MSKNTINTVTLLGRLGADPEIRYTSSGIAVSNISVATRSTIKKDGKFEEETQWHLVVLFGKNAEFALQYLKKGSLVYVVGEIKYSKYTNKEGQNVKKTTIIAKEFIGINNSKNNDILSTVNVDVMDTASSDANSIAVKYFEADSIKDDLPF